jgi:hypothetical protein
MSKKSTAVTESRRSISARKKAIPPDGIRCKYTDLANRQCRNLALRPKGSGASESKSGFCLAHATEMRQLHDAEAVADEMIGVAPKLDTPLGVNYVLAKLFEMTINDRITIRKAALLTYQASLLIQSAGGVKEVIQKTFVPKVWDNMIVKAVKTIDAIDAIDEADSDSAPEPESESDSEQESESAPVSA